MAIVSGATPGTTYSLSRYATQLSSYRRPCGPFELAGSTCGLQSTPSALRASDGCLRGSPDSIKPLLHNAGHDFAIFVKRSSIPLPYEGNLQPTAASVSECSVTFWVTKYTSQHDVLLPDTYRFFWTFDSWRNQKPIELHRRHRWHLRQRHYPSPSGMASWC